MIPIKSLLKPFVFSVFISIVLDVWRNEFRYSFVGHVNGSLTNLNGSSRSKKNKENEISQSSHIVHSSTSKPFG